eukprot:TRINITY_DN6014_c0_g1_i2.p1 TRINITY_DN6014_c0_g1~~TRINITY_DN6014_c0_g1_i2.p1  ORF type:complete len:279 (+),score=38.53 TRINITY_DN6014_c0_g1_i2:182-1018(+)
MDSILSVPLYEEVKQEYNVENSTWTVRANDIKINILLENWNWTSASAYPGRQPILSAELSSFVCQPYNAGELWNSVLAGEFFDMTTPGVNQVFGKLDSGSEAETNMFAGYDADGEIVKALGNLPLEFTFVDNGVSAVGWEKWTIVRKGRGDDAVDPADYIGKPIPMQLLIDRKMDLYGYTMMSDFYRSYNKARPFYDPNIRLLVTSADGSVGDGGEQGDDTAGGDGGSSNDAGWIAAVVVVIVVAFICAVLVGTTMCILGIRRRNKLSTLLRSNATIG